MSMKRGRPNSGGISRNTDYYVRKIKSSDAKGCNKITNIFKKISEKQEESPRANDAIEKCVNESSLGDKFKNSNLFENEPSLPENSSDSSALCDKEPLFPENPSDNAALSEYEESQPENPSDNAALSEYEESQPENPSDNFSVIENVHSPIEEDFSDDASISSNKSNSANITEQFSQKQRPLNIQKYEKLNNWIYYSVTSEGFLCKICSVAYSKGPWVDQAINLGDHPNRCINKHQSSSKHKQAVSAREINLRKPLCDSLVEGAKVVAEKAKEANQKLMIKYIKILYFMIRKQWAVSENFSSLVRFIGEDLGDQDIEAYLSTCGKNATYLSNVSVLNLTEAISMFLEERTLTALQVSEHFALLADESTDEAQREQLGLIVRYTVHGRAELREEYLGLINLSATNAASITSAIQSFFIAKGINITNCLFLALDGTNVMSGDISGVQRRIRHLSPHSIYINCRNHRLALVFVHLLKKYKLIQAVDALLISLWKLFHYSPVKQQVFKDIQGEVYGVEILKTLKVSVTRWLSHGVACERIVTRYKQLVETLDAIFEKTKEPEVKGIREQLLDTENLLCILFLADFLKIINSLSTWLQSPNIMFSNVSKKVESTLSEVVKYVSDLHKGENFKKCDDFLLFAKECTELSMKTRKKKQKLNSDEDVIADFKDNFITDFIEDFKKEIKNAFKIDNEALSAFDVFRCLDLDLTVGNDKTCVAVLFEFYGQEQKNEFQGAIKASPPIIDATAATKEISSFEKEISLAKITFDMEKGMKARTFLKEDKKEEAKKVFEKNITPAETLEIVTRDPTSFTKFPHMLKLLSLSTIIPSSTASVERLFSQMNLVCTELKTRMTQETLDRHLRIIINGPEKLSDPECEAVLNIFKSTGNRRILL